MVRTIMTGFPTSSVIEYELVELYSCQVDYYEFQMFCIVELCDSEKQDRLNPNLAIYSMHESDGKKLHFRFHS
jgi:hypothetical protein